MPPNDRRRTLGWLLAAGAAPVFLRHVRAADAPRFALGIASGSPTADGMVLWTRLVGDDLPPEVDVRWQLAHDERFTRIAATGVETARAADAHSVHAEPRALEPAREYFYRFEALGQRSGMGRTRTAPASDATVARLEFAIASCQRWDHGHYAAWRDLAERAPELVLFLGDYIYEYASPPWALRSHLGGRVRTLDGYRQRYAQYKGDPALQAAHAACPWIVIWDDHEVDNDYAGLQGAELQRGFAEQRAAAYRAWWEHMPVPQALRPRDGTTRIFGRLDWGRLARLHWLDDRQYRDPQACPRPLRGGANLVRLADCQDLVEARRSLLGIAQERWLADGWSLDRPWNLLAQQTLMARLYREDALEPGPLVWTDGWDGYPAARGRLLGVVAERRVPGVVVLGGDLHATVVADLRADFDDPKAPTVATEFCGTSISSHGPAQARLDAALRLNPHLRHARGDERGYLHFQLLPDRLETEVRSVLDPRDPASALRVAARFAVDARQPGAQRA